MGDRLGNTNNSRAFGPTPATPATGTSNASATPVVQRRSEAPARPAQAPVATTLNVDPGQLTSFLQEFTSLDEFRSQYPDLSGVSLPEEMTEEHVPSFARLLKDIPDREQRLETYTPAVVLAGLKELTTRAGGSERSAGKQALERTSRMEVSESGVQQYQPPARRRRGRANILGHMQNREMGRGHRSIPIRFAAGRRDDHAGLAVVLGGNVKKLKQHYDEAISGILASTRATDPRLHDAIRALRDSFEDEIIADPLGFLSSLLDIQDTDAVFFSRLTIYESCLRLYRNASAGVSEADLELETTSAVRATLAEVGLSLLVFERSKPEFAQKSPFQKSLVDSMICLSDTGDYEKAQAVFKSGMKDFQSSSSENLDTDRYDTFVERVRYLVIRDLRDLTNTSTSDQEEGDLIEFIDPIIYHHFLINGDSSMDLVDFFFGITFLIREKPVQEDWFPKSLLHDLMKPADQDRRDS